MKIEAKNMGLVLTGVLGLAALAYTFVIFVPGRNDLAQVRAEILQRQQYIVQTKPLEAQLTEQQSRLESTRQYVQHQRALMPREAELARYTGELTGSASAAGVNILRFSPQFTQVGPLLAHAPVTLAVEGELAQVYDFAGKLESFEIPLWCQRFTIEPYAKEANRVRAEFDLLLFADNSEKSD